MNVSTQCGPSSRSYGKTSEHITFRSLLLDVIYTKDATLDFCFRHKLLTSERLCPTCGKKMTLITDSKVSDGKRWYCRVRKGPHSHEHRLTMRTDTFFSKSNMTLEEILQFIYLWVHGNSQDTIAHELGKFQVIADSSKIGATRKSGYFSFLSISHSGEVLQLQFSAELMTTCLRIPKVPS